MSSCTRASDSERCRSDPIVYSPSRSERRWVAKCSFSQIASSIWAPTSGSMLPETATWRSESPSSSVALLRPDELRGVRFAAVELGEHLVGGVAAPRGVALDLPLAPQLLGRGEVHPH